MVACFGAKEVWVQIPLAQFFLSCDRREKVIVFSRVSARDVREKQISRASLQGRSGEGGVEERGTVWYFKMKEVDV